MYEDGRLGRDGYGGRAKDGYEVCGDDGEDAAGRMFGSGGGRVGRRLRCP